MSTDDKLPPEQSLTDWLDKKVADCNVSEEPLWQARKETAEHIRHCVDIHAEQPVPNWDRSSTFTTEKVSFWQWQGLPALSMACSIFAIALVLFKVELVVQDGGILLSFAGKGEEVQSQKLDALIDNKLQLFAKEQQVLLANYSADIKVQQQDNNLQLASYIMGASRQERKEDITDFIRYINEQRKDEQLDQRIKYQQLEQAIQAQRNYPKTSSEGLGIQNNDAVLTPVNWTTEE